MAEPRTFDGTITFQHYLELSKAAQQRRQNPRGLPMLLLWLMLVAAFTAGISMLPELLGNRMEGFGFGVLAGALLLVLIFTVASRFYSQRMFRDDGSILGLRHYRLEDDGIFAEGVHGYAMTRWSAVTDESETANTVLLWTDPGAAVVVPKAALGDASAVTAFRAGIRSRIGGTAEANSQRAPN